MSHKNKTKSLLPARILALRRFFVVKHAFPIALFALLIFLGGFFLHRIVICNYKARQFAQLRATVAAIQNKEHDLRSLKRFLQTPEGIKFKGIEKGYLEKGDYPVRFTPQQSAATTPINPEDATAAENAGVFAAMLFLFAIISILGFAILLYRKRKMRKPISDNVLTPRLERKGKYR